MQYVRSISGSVSKTWNSINPATLSGAIDVIVVEQEDGSLACSPFHIRFGKFSLLRPSEKKVEFKVNGEKQEFPMKLGEGGEAFFVFETQDRVPEALQTSPLVSPATSPQLTAGPSTAPTLQEPDTFELEGRSDTSSNEALRKPGYRRGTTTEGILIPTGASRSKSDAGALSILSQSPVGPPRRASTDFTALSDSLLPKLERMPSDSAIPAAKAALSVLDGSEVIPGLHAQKGASALRHEIDRPPSAVSQEQEEARTRAMNLSKRLWTSNISNQVTDSGDLMLDMTGYKSGNMEALQAEGIARQLLSEELDGPYDIGSLIGADDKGNIWIYSSEEAKEAANRKATAEGLGALNPAAYASTDAISDPGYHSDDAQSHGQSSFVGSHARRDSDSALGMPSQPSSPGPLTAGDPNKNYAKTLRLTSDQLKTMSLQLGANEMAFTVNRATCRATLWYWRHDVPIVISDIDGTITKSDVLGHLFTQIGRDWTHSGVAKLYTEIASNGYNFMYLTSRSVGLADTTRAYLDGVIQDGFRLPKGPVILSPDRTIAALRREVYLRKPEIFKMACCRDIMSLFSGHGGANNTTDNALEAGLKPSNMDQPGNLGTGRGKSGSPFYAGFGNRLTDALSYRSVNIPSTRIFTINSNSEVSLDLLSLNKYKTAYSSMREIVDHYFPPVGLLVKGGGEEFTDFNYWRERPLDLVDFTDSEDEEDDIIASAVNKLSLVDTGASTVLSEDEAGDDMHSSYLSESRQSFDGSALDEESVADDEEDELTDDGELEFEVEVEGVTSGPRTPEPRRLERDLERTPDANRHVRDLGPSALEGQDDDLD